MKAKWIYLFLAVTFLALLNIGVYVTDDLANGYSVDWMKLIINELTGAWLLLPLLPGLFWFFDKMPITRSTFWVRLPFHLVVTIGFGAAHTLLMIIARTPLYQLAGLGDYLETYGILEYRMIMEYFKQFLFYWVFYGGFILYRKIRENQEQKLHAVQLEEALTRARLQSLQMQLNPHFLFNTLNAISGMMYENIDEADKMMSTLSDMLRSTLRIQTEEHSVEQELALLDRYLEIMKVRFKEKLETSVEVDERAKLALVPVFLLQPLLENAIKYGVEHRGNVDVRLAIHANNSQLLMQVQDNGPGIKSTSGNGIGWSNTMERLEKLFGDSHQFKLENRPEGGLRVTVGIPLHFESV